MATSINSYSVSLGMDASGYIQGAHLSRSETRLLVKDIESARTPAENFARDQDRLREALEKGSISLGVHQRLHESLREQYGITDVSVMSTASKLTGPLAIGFGVVTAAVAASTAAGVAFVSHMKETQDQIDSVADSATKLGVSYNELTGIRFAAQEAGGVDAGTVDASIKKMQINISKAISDPDSEINEAFKKLGVSAGQLMQAGPVESVKLLADGMQGVNSQADKLQLAMEIFGKSGTEMVSTLMGGRDAIEESVDFQNRWNGLTDAQVVAVQASNDAWDRIGVVINGISTEMASEFAPAFLVVADELLGMESSIATVNDGMQLLVNSTAYYLGQLKDIAEIFISMPMMVTGFGGQAGAAFDLSSGQRAMEAVIEKREQLEQDASKKIEERRLAIETLAIEEGISKKEEAEKALIDRLQREINDAADDRIRKEEQKRLEMQRRLSNEALKAAEDHFKKEQYNARKLREDIAKGPTSMEAGSADAAKFMADQVNAAIAANVSPDQPKPTEEQMLAETIRQRELAEKKDARDASILTALEAIRDKKPDVSKFR